MLPTVPPTSRSDVDTPLVRDRPRRLCHPICLHPRFPACQQARSRFGVAVAVLNGTDLEAAVPSAPSGHIDPKTGGDKLMMRRRDFLASAAATCLAPGLAGAQGAWPQRSISLVVPFSAGGSADLVARMFAQHFQAKYGVSVVIENKGGAGGSIGSARSSSTSAGRCGIARLPTPSVGTATPASSPIRPRFTPSIMRENSSRCAARSIACRRRRTIRC